MFEGGNISVSAADDVFFSSLANGQVIRYNSGTSKWNNATIPAQFNPIAGANVTLSGTYPNITFTATGNASSPTYANLPAGTTITVMKNGSTWPSRPTDRDDIVVQWKGPDPSPAIITTGTGGMLNNVDIRLVTP